MKYLIYLLSLLLLGLLDSCSDGERGKESIPTLEVVTSSIDFDENGGTKNIDVVTNQENWTAVVDAVGENWCTAVPDRMNDQNQLVVSTIANSYKEMRSTNVTLKAGNLNKKIAVRQLGTDKGILISPIMLTVKSEGEMINFTVTANVEFEIITPDWITLPVKTRSAEYVTTEHVYVVQRNTGEKREGEIIIKDKESDLTATLSISQEAFGDYQSGESSIKGDILVEVSDGSAVNAKGETTVNGSSVFRRTYDKSKETGWHSNTRDVYPDTNWPLKLTFEFKEQPRIDYCVYHPTSSNVMKKAEIYVSTEEEPEYKKVMDAELPGSGVARISFPEPIINPKGIQMVVTETSGQYLVIKEMEFYRKNPANYDPLELFRDITCTELKDGITMKEVDACPDPLFRNIAAYMLLDKYPRDFRIQDYKAYPHANLFKKNNKTSQAHDLLQNVTGIYVKKGKEVVMLVGDTHGYSLSVRILNLDTPGKDGFDVTYSHPLAEGVNRFEADSDGLLYIYYHTPEYKDAAPIAIHIPSGEVNGYFDSRIHESPDWKRLLDAAKAPHFDVIGEKAHLIFPTDKFKANTPDGKSLIDAYDRLVELEQEFIGLVKYGREDPNHVCFSVMYNDAHMYSAAYHTGYVITTINALTTLERFTTSDIWGPAHEVGHSYQTSPGMCWFGMTEVTNNILSLYVQTSFGNTTRLYDQQSYDSKSKYTSIYEKSMCKFFLDAERPYIRTDSDVNVLNQLVPFWQLYLYTKVKGYEDFYKDLFEQVRLRPDKHNRPGENQVDFAVLASEVSGYDLTEFFTKWGFFVPVDEEKEDYGKRQYTVTKEMVVDAKQRIADMHLPKAVAVEYITDDAADCYVSSSPVSPGTAERNDATFTMKNWKNVVAYEVYSDDKLCFVSPASSFTVLGEKLGEKVEVFAISAQGEKTKVNF